MSAFGCNTPDPMETEELVQCPYVKNHMIRRSRYPYHLVNCKEKNPHIAKKFSTCPYNARHVVPKKELEKHLQTCEDKVILELPQVNINIPPRNNLPQSLPRKENSLQSSPTQEYALQRSSPKENWDDDCGGSVFVLKNFGNQKPHDPSDIQDSCNFSVSAAPKQYTGIKMNPGMKMNQGTFNRNAIQDGGSAAGQWETVSRHKPQRNWNSGNGQTNRTGQ